MQQAGTEGRLKTDFVGDALTIFGLFNLTVARPLFEVLARYAEFFVFKRISRFELLLFIFVISILFPGILVLVRFLISKISVNVSQWFQWLLISVFTLAFALPGLNRQDLVASHLFMTALILICCIASVGYFRFHWLRLFYLYLAPAVVIVPLLFIVSPKIWRLMFSKPVDIPDVSVRSETPVILVVFDEFPVVSLLDEKRNVDSLRYPNFTRLAREWNWYRRTSTVAERTAESLAGILTGSYPQTDRLPITVHYPKNLFTLFAKSYDLRVFETVTWMNPSEIVFGENQGRIQAWRSLSSDLGLVYLHIVLPHKYSALLPPITQSWGDFASDTGKGKADRRMYSRNPAFHLQSFLNSIQPANKPVLHFIHAKLPHSPWYFLPSGKNYGSPTYEGMNLVFAKWMDDEAAVQRSYQRHLMQVGFVDHWIGELIRKLQESALYDRSIIVVTADHGVSFTTGQTLRTVTKKNAEEIIFVPLFIKAPGQKIGAIVDWNVETIDILPTIAELAGVEVPWEMDGFSVATSPPPKDRTRIVCSEYCKTRHRFDASFKSDDEALQRKLRWFGSGAMNFFNPCREIIGQSIENQAETASGMSGKLRDKELFSNVSLQSDFIPVFVAGRIHGPALSPNQIALGISVNGVLQATTLSSPLDSTTHNFDALIPEGSLRAGKNDVQIYFLPTCGERPQRVAPE